MSWKRANLWCAWCLLAVCPAIASAQEPAADPDLAANAAVQYWQAFGLMPTLDKEQEELLQNWQTVPLDAAAVKLIDSGRNSVMYLRRGAKLSRCDWGLDYEDGIGMLLPHLAKARDLARLAALEARYNFEQGNRPAARENAHAMMVLARHVGRDPIMITVLVRYLIEGVTVDLLAPWVPEMKAPHAMVVSRYEALPAAPDVKDTILIEKRTFLEWVIRKLREAEQAKPGSWRDLWTNLLGAQGPEDLKKVGTLDEVVRLLEDVLPVYDELARVVALPPSEFDARFPEFKQRVEAASPLAAVFVPNVDKLRATENRNRARMAMLLAAMAVAHSGPDALQDIRDPFGNGPFEYRELEGGFELTSKLVHDGQPVTLRAGRVASGAKPAKED
jgi:hypothetical protein